MITIRQYINLSVLRLTLFVIACSVSTQSVRANLIPQNILNQHGLKRAWFAQIDLDRSNAKIAHVVHHVSRLHSTSTDAPSTEIKGRFFVVYQVTVDNRSYSFSERDLDRFGNPLGQPGARRLANFKLEDLQRAGHAANLSELIIPEVTVFVQTTSGSLHALDGHTGRKKWSASLGSERLENFSPTVNENYVATVHGSTLVVLDRDTGDILWERRLKGAPGAGPALTEKQALIPLYRGQIEVISLDTTEKYRDNWHYATTGQTYSRPTANSTHVCWTTDRGLLYVADPVDKGLKFRVETNFKIASPATLQGNKRAFASSVDGYLHAVNLTSEKIDWRFSTGETINASPVVIGNSVYLVTQYSGMYCVSSETGQELWRTPHIRQFIAAGADRIYCAGTPGQIFVLNPQTGTILDSLNVSSNNLTFTNTQSDRIFLGAESGLIQCLHPSSQIWPLSHETQEVPQAEDVNPDSTSSPLSPTPSDSAVEDDPLDSDDSDPFGVD